MNGPKWIATQTELLQQAESVLNRLQSELTTVSEQLNDQNSRDDSVDSNWEALRMIQLMLQYRLDSQDALRHLLQFQQSAWQVLGVSAQHSSKINLERLSFALGCDDLHHLLSLVGELIDALQRIMQRYHLTQAEQEKDTADRKRRLKLSENQLSKAYRAMARVVTLERSFLSVMAQLQAQMALVAGEAESLGPIFDYIGRLEGPIERFHLAHMHGIMLAGGMYQLLHQKVQLSQLLMPILGHKLPELGPQLALRETPRLYQPTPSREASWTLEQLEERAAEKRFGSFFYHP